MRRSIPLVEVRPVGRPGESAQDNGGYRGCLAPQTAANASGVSIPAVFEWRLLEGSGQQITRCLNNLLFYDTAGEDLATRIAHSDNTTLMHERGYPLLDPFGFPGNHDKAIARGVDPASLETTPETVLRSIITVLQNAERTKRNKKIKQPVAVVVSKIDAFFDDVPPDHPMRRPAQRLPYFDDTESAASTTMSRRWLTAGAVIHCCGLDTNLKNIGCSVHLRSARSRIRHQACQQPWFAAASGCRSLAVVDGGQRISAEGELDDVRRSNLYR